MKTYTNPQSTIVILERGEELIRTLKTYAEDASLSSAWLQSGLGGASSVTLSFYDIATKTYIDKVFDEPLEIISLQGNLTQVENEPFWHVHGVFGTRDYQTISGHIKAVHVSLTCELLILPMEIQLTRDYDEATGLKLIRGSN